MKRYRRKYYWVAGDGKFYVDLEKVLINSLGSFGIGMGDVVCVFMFLFGDMI